LHIRRKLALDDLLDSLPYLEARIQPKDAKPEAKRRAAKQAEADASV